MQLQAARLCLDCEEVHEGQQCPICASESFAAMTRWVPSAERRGRPRPAVAPEAAAYRVFAGQEPPSRGRQLLKQGALGLTAVGLIGWLLRSKPGAKPADAAGAPTSPDK
jgi:hypothetical protein